MNKVILARRVNRLARLKAQISALENKAASDIEVLKKAGGATSSKWIAKIIKMPKRIQMIPAHKQLRLYGR